MGECPLCGQPTYKASTRLIKDACGHTKCRLCLLQEENGCSVCKSEKVEKFLYRNNSIDNFETSSYESCNNKPLELVVNKIPVNSTHISCLSITSKFTISKNNSKNIKRIQTKDIEKECDKNERNKRFDNNAIEKQFTTEEQKKNPIPSFESTYIHKLNDVAVEPNSESTENASSELRSTNYPSIEKRSATDKNNCVTEAIEECQKEKEDYVPSIIAPLELVVEKDPDTFVSRDCSSIEKRFSTTEDTVVVEKTEENNREKLDCDKLNKTPNQFLYNRSPDFKLSDYVLFTNKNEKIIQNEFVGSPTKLLGYRSPDFQLSDYVLFKKKLITEENATDIEEKNHNEKTDHDKSDVEPFPFIVNQNLENNHHLSSSIENRIVVGKDTAEKEEQNQNERVNYDHLKCYEFPSYSVLEKQLRDNENFTNKVENSHNKEKGNEEPNDIPVECIDQNSNNLERIDNLSIEKIVEKQACNNTKDSQTEKIEDDEDKENKEKHNERKEIEISTKEGNNTKSDSLTSVNHETHKTKDTIQQDEDKKTNKRKKSLSKQSKQKKIEDQSKKNDTQIIIRKGKRKRKPKVLYYENDFEETKRAAPKRRKSGKDWSHITTLSGSTITYKCTLCEKVFKSPRGKWYHAACLSGQVPFRCQVCGRTFAKRSHFEYHERMHTGNKPFRCTVCEKSFVQKSKLNRHMLIHKQKNDIECAECGRRFSTKQYLKNHMTIHQNNSFKCKFCPKTFTLAFNRKRHERSHSTDRPYKCDICSKDFKGKFLLTRHRRTHDKNRPFSCHDCHRVFLSKFEVQRHMSVHSDVKPYACNQCNLEFRRKDNLNRHVKHHHTIDYDASQSVETNAKTTDEQLDNVLEKVNNDTSDKTADEEQQRNEKTNSKSKEMDKPVNTVKPKPKPKRISRSNSTSSTKSLLKTSLCSPQPHRQIGSKPDLSNAVPVIRGPISIKRFTENSEIHGTRLGFTQPIPLEEAVVLNRQIEEKIYTQDSFCNYPGLNRRSNSIIRRRDSCGSNSNSNDGVNFACKQNQERSKTVHFSKEDPSDGSKNDEPKIVKDINLHWRRRTAESLKTKVAKNKQT